MPRVSWLHLTDLHRGMSAQGLLWPNIEKPFFEDLAWLKENCGPWDFIMFSGDLVQGGDPREFVKFDETLKRLYERLNSLGSNPVLIVVPGNHDLRRPDSSDPAVEKLQRFHQDRSVSKEFWNKPGSPARRLVKTAFQPFVTWHERHKFAKPSELKHGILPGDFAATIDHEDIKVGIIGLNSTFLQLKDGDYKGRLALDATQIISVCGEHFTDWFDQHTICFLMTHHPDLLPAFRTSPSMISDERKGKEYVEEQAHGSGDDRGAEATRGRA